MRCPATVRDARETRALISSPRYRVTAATHCASQCWLIGTTLALRMTTLETTLSKEQQAKAEATLQGR